MAGPEGAAGSRWTGTGASGIATGSAVRCTREAEGGGMNAGVIGDWMADAAGAGNALGTEASELIAGEDGPCPSAGSSDRSTESVEVAWGAAAVTRTRSRGAGAGAVCEGAVGAAEGIDAVRATVGAGSGVARAAGAGAPGCPASTAGWALPAVAGA